jgi:hypothetical protein
MAKKKRRKRKSRTELYTARKTKEYFVVLRAVIPVRGGNQFGLGEWTLRVAGMGFISGD